MKTLLCLVALLQCAAVLGGESTPPAFTKKPTASRGDDKIKIEFAVSRETDVTVSIEDSSGKAIRHLVAGVLGKNAPEPLQKSSLSQSIEWDGKDDNGTPAASGAYKVKVGLGLSPKLEEYLLNDPSRPGGRDSLGMDKEGNLYHCGSAGGIYFANAAGMLMQSYDRQGKYLRTIVPFAANLPLEKIKGTGAFQADGHTYPVFHNISKMRMYPSDETTGHEMIVTSSGRIVKLAMADGSRLCLQSLNKDGSLPTEVPFLGTPLLPARRTESANQRTWIAMSGNEQWVYLSGVVVRAADKFPRLNAVWRAPLDGSKAGEVFLGDPDKSGNDEKLFNRPMGVAIDGKGCLYVADQGNNRIQIFQEADGKFVGTLAVDCPTTVQVHPKTGAIYVLSSPPGGGAISLVKFSGRDNAKPAAHLAVGRSVDERYAAMVLDASTEPAVLWIGGSWRELPLQRIEDKGATLAATPAKLGKGDPDPGNCENLLVDRNRDQLYLKPTTEKFIRVDLKTGKTESLGYPAIGDATGTQIAISPSGDFIYAFSHLPGCLRKFDRDFKPVNFEAVGKASLEIASPMNFSCRSLGVAPNGDVHVIPVNPGKNSASISEVQIYGPDGKRKGTAIWRCYETTTGPKFDRQGNIYLADPMRPRGQAMQDFFKGRLPDYKPELYGADRPYNTPLASTVWVTGSIVKFPATGGVIWYQPQSAHPGKAASGQEVPESIRALPKTTVSYVWRNGGLVDVDVQGMLWQHLGCSPVVTKIDGNFSCNCQSSCFDVDDFGRVFFPDVTRFRVGVIDTNGNEIVSFGHYGNRDSSGPGSMIPEPEIAFAYAYSVAISRSYVLVGDLLNRRVAKLRLASTVEETADIK